MAVLLLQRSTFSPGGSRGIWPTRRASRCSGWGNPPLLYGELLPVRGVGGGRGALGDGPAQSLEGAGLDAGPAIGGSGLLEFPSVRGSGGLPASLFPCPSPSLPSPSLVCPSLRRLGCPCTAIAGWVCLPRSLLLLGVVAVVGLPPPVGCLGHHGGEGCYRPPHLWLAVPVAGGAVGTPVESGGGLGGGPHSGRGLEGPWQSPPSWPGR